MGKRTREIIARMCKERGFKVYDLCRMLGLEMTMNERPAVKTKCTLTPRATAYDHKMDAHTWTVEEFLRFRKIFGLTAEEAVKLLLSDE